MSLKKGAAFIVFGMVRPPIICDRSKSTKALSHPKTETRNNQRYRDVYSMNNEFTVMRQPVPILLLLLSLLFAHVAFAQSRTYDADRATARNGLYHWDRHDYLAPATHPQVRRVLIYHRPLDRQDSILESEWHYDSSGRTIFYRQFAAPGDGGWIEMDSFYYNDRGRLANWIQWRVDGTKIDTTEHVNYFDTSGRLAQAEIIWQRRSGIHNGREIHTCQSQTTYYWWRSSSVADTGFYGSDDSIPEWSSVHFRPRSNRKIRYSASSADVGKPRRSSIATPSPIRWMFTTAQPMIGNSPTASSSTQRVN
jgi:hypothetical protein